MPESSKCPIIKTPDSQLIMEYFGSSYYSVHYSTRILVTTIKMTFDKNNKFYIHIHYLSELNVWVVMKAGGLFYVIENEL